MRRLRLRLLPEPRVQTSWTWLLEAVYWTGVVAGDHHDPDRDHQPPGSHAFANYPSVRQYVCRRHGDVGFLLARAHWSSYHFYGPAHRGFVSANLHFRIAHDRV